MMTSRNGATAPIAAPVSKLVERISRAVIVNDLTTFKKLSTILGTVNIECGGETAVQLAILSQQLDIFDFIVDQPDFDVDFKSSNGWTALQSVVCHSSRDHRSAMPNVHKYFIARLVEKGADVNSNNIVGLTLFNFACLTGYDECIETLLLHGADPTFNPLTGYRSFDCGVSSCSRHTLEVLFNYTYDDVEPITLCLNTLKKLLKNNRIEFLEAILHRVSYIHIPPQYNMNNLIQQLHKLPFRIFEGITQKFLNVATNLQTLEALDLKHLNASPDVLPYLKFFCANCKNIKRLNCTPLLSAPGMCLELLAELLFLPLSNGIPVDIDLDQMYALYGFSPLFEALLHHDITFVKEAGPSFVPVWYNTVLTSELPLSCKTDFVDQRFYFETVRTPSLLQLSRDASRQGLIQGYDIKNHTQLAAFWQKLPIYDDFKDILRFKRKIYN